MVYYERRHGASSPPEICCDDCDTLLEAQDCVESLRQENDWRDEDYKRDGWSPRDEYSDIKLCIVLEEVEY